MRVITGVEFKLAAIEGRIERGQLRNDGPGQAEIGGIGLDADGLVAGGCCGGKGKDEGRGMRDESAFAEQQAAADKGGTRLDKGVL
ncbi:MAG: hypothetical protein HY360_13755 [Verrucomicrobia bacterium]|nr:hypothetical protein [Verrucomicrobiota bacterium]